MIVGTCGTGYSGSGAVLDILKEYDENFVIDNFEFNLLYTPDGVADLDYHLNIQKFRYFSSDTAIRRFIRLINIYSSGRSNYQFITNNTFKKTSYSFIESIIQCKWRGTGSGDSIDLSWLHRKFRYSFLQRLQNYSDNLTGRYFEIRPKRNMYLSLEPIDFYENVQIYMNNIFEAICSDKTKNIVLDQLFPGNNPEACYKYIKNPVGIIVYRDPRDVFVLAKKFLLTKGQFMPLDNVKVFTEYYKRIHETILCQTDEKTLIFRFEDLVFDYEKSIKIIEKKLNIKRHSAPLKFFNPTLSKNNTALFIKYPEYNQEVQYIEDNLREWLYDFQLNKINSNKGKVF